MKMQIHGFLLFFIVGAILTGVYTRPAEDDDTGIPSIDGPSNETDCSDESTVELRTNLRSIRSERKFDSALLLQAPIPNSVPSAESNENSNSTESGSNESDSNESDSNESGSNESSEKDNCILSIFLNTLEKIIFPWRLL